MMDEQTSPMMLELVLRCRELDLEELVTFADALHDAVAECVDEDDMHHLYGALGGPSLRSVNLDGAVYLAAEDVFGLLGAIQTTALDVLFPRRYSPSGEPTGREFDPSALLGDDRLDDGKAGRSRWNLT